MNALIGGINFKVLPIVEAYRKRLLWYKTCRKILMRDTTHL